MKRKLDNTENSDFTKLKKAKEQESTSEINNPDAMETDFQKFEFEDKSEYSFSLFTSLSAPRKSASTFRGTLTTRVKRCLNNELLTLEELQEKHASEQTIERLCNDLSTTNFSNTDFFR
ncbi:MAG: hypothetical protein K0R98_497 [Rickettsiaceae bacterium]|jgi:uncharacterized alpha-E superfamily protein|nr:hypothetical protein [Rickettsiaceae bacterium]